MACKKLGFIVLTAVLIVMLYFVFEYFFIPQNIYMTTGESYSVNISAPFRAEISSPVVSVNNKKVENNIELSLEDENILKCDRECNADMNIKAFGIPVKKVQLCFLPEKRVMVSGRTVGICVDTNGVLVLGTGEVTTKDGKSTSPCKGIIKSGDIILAVNNKEVGSKEDVTRESEGCETVTLKLKRNNNIMEVNAKTALSAEDGRHRLGLWIRDSTQGIGTITYYDKQTREFGALGHPINDVDTGKKIEIDGGEILNAKVINADRGKAGTPGALIGEVDFNDALGVVNTNEDTGIFGKLSKNISGVEMPIGYKNDVKIGNASIYISTKGEFVERYDVHIDSINRYNTSGTKNFVMTITDKRLLDMTGGIVQGMSGCPVVQDGKLIGAVTHVFLNDPTKGYGIFIENMYNFE